MRTETLIRNSQVPQVDTEVITREVRFAIGIG